ncbi:MAG: 2,3-bisphosphoglycerate-independent phosphoglycerate mutase [Oscillospiraceae bacterium]|nr:2,3-bisphosphoglycerate-independent phosphoglycerate mutase [Oscillospiraceae bacterium]MDD4545914.1 2,3-bisphosphoglycerate-independent phosphoglycerate mutase [Oscillospiraceae bacterium]
MKKPVTLIIMDGFGYNPDSCSNAIKSANTPNLDRYFAHNPFTAIAASGMDVGLPKGQMGNSEVGHTNIGAGRVVYQELTRISKSIDDGDFFANPVLIDAINNAKKPGSALHLLGLLSDGGVHSHNTHLYALLSMAKLNGLDNVYVHVMLDGRDVPPTSGAGFIRQLQDKLKEIGIGKIATVMGRYYGMDRDSQWGRVNKAYAAMVYREGLHSSDPAAAVEISYKTTDAEGKFTTDEFVVPSVIEGGKAVTAGDSLIFFNFRPDRAREITRTFVDSDFKGFERKDGRLPLSFVCMTEYDATMPNVQVAFEPKELTMTMGEVVSRAGKTQLRIAETTKYAHVTFFFNGGEEVMFEGEDRVLIPTPDVATFDLKPEMSAYAVCEAVEERILAGKYDMIVLNFANCDMVGHTGIFDAAVKAVEVVDECVGRVVEAILKMNGTALITADHGNADQMSECDGTPFTAHTLSPVPFCVIGTPCTLREGGRLADIAPTMLKVMGIPKPPEMDGTSIII